LDACFIKIQNLSKAFKKQPTAALDQLNVELPAGKMIGLIGPDGAGKTTLIRILTGLLQPSEGTVHVDGFDVQKETAKIHAMIGYMPQKFGLYEDLSVIENLNLYADLQGISFQEKAQVFERLLTFSNLAPFRKRLARNLSGGMKQKLGLSCALLKKPKLLLLDEPTVGVDPISRRELWNMVFDLLHEGITVLWSTSYLDEAEKCDIILLMNEGKVLSFGPPKDLTAKLQNRTFLVKDVSEQRRSLLTELMQKPIVLDAVVQSSSIRMVLKEAIAPETLQEELQKTVERTAPRFEDAFIDILGGSYKGESLIAKRMEKMEDGLTHVIEAKNLTKRFGTFTAVDAISFSVKKGEIFGLLGPNGAGKSTTFKMLCGLLKPTQGEAYVTGLSLQQAPSEARAQVGYMAQKFSLYGNMTVLQNLKFFSGIYPVPLDKRKEVIEEMIEVFDLKAFLDSSAFELPLGFKQRLALACSLMHAPRVLFLDEPTAGVDPLTRREFWTHINGLVQKGMTIMVTTHFMDEAEYCDRIGLIEDGKLINLGTPEELKEKVKTQELPEPTLEDAFVILSQSYKKKSHERIEK
jgi:ABC-2 type transport system ATP-binding protein